MSEKINPEELQKSIMNYLESYKEDIQDDVKESADTISKEVKNELIQKSPRSGIARKTNYYKGWTIKLGARSGKTRYRYTKVVWNKTNYQLTHLLEFGHHKRNGKGWVEAQPHIRIVEEKYKTKFADLLERKIREDSK